MQLFKTISLSLLILPLTIINSANAGCDPCIQSAAQSASTQMSSAINGVTSSVQANVSATQALNTSVQAVNTSLQATVNLNTQQLLQGLDASTNRIELSVQQNTKTAERMADHTVKTLVKTLKEVRVAEEVDENNKIYSDILAQPLSGEIGANRAPLLKQGMVQSRQMWKQMAEDMYDWTNNTADVDQAGKGIKKAVLLKEGSAAWDPVPLITQRQITSTESINLQKLLTMLVNPVPLPSVTDEQMASSPKAADYEFDRRILNAKLGLAHSVLAKSIADKQPLIPISTNDWQKGYVMAEPDADGKVSVLSMLESETVGRLGSEGWYQDIKTKTPAGILREQVYQQAINNQLLLRLVEQDEQKLSMLALMAISEIEKSKPTPPSTRK
jgi:D-ribose pyranose/furanose isomerase RbsD|tara:strand:+ start:15542 stop:16699 length:1158 start_codon:yes stop_codon:yes gene_type:complete